jgi:hypothetical protein
MAPLPDLISWLRLPVAAVIFLLPGWLLARCFATPFPVLTAFLGSAAIFFNSVLLLDALRVPVQAGPLCLVIVLWCLLLGRRALRARPAETPGESAGPFWPRGWDRLWLMPVALAVASLALRAVIDPLSGWDNDTRWDYFARLILAQGSLAHYPPVTAQDFNFYSWCDGIPPLAPILNFWIYAACGSSAPALTAGRVLAEAVLLGFAVHRLSTRLWGEKASWPALAVLATSPLLLWSCAIGQETGLLAVSFVSLLLLLEEHRANPGGNLAGWAGVAAGVGAISREYGLAFILFGAAVLAWRPAERRSIRWFLATAGLVAFPWYLRNWLLTGNPLFPHAFGGLFPTNPVHGEMMRAIAGYWGINAGYFDPWHFPVVLTCLAGPLLLLGAIGAVRAGRRGVVCVLGIILIAGLWWWAIPSTAGGWNYAGRVLAPGLVLAGVLAGWVVQLPRGARVGLLAMLTVLAVDASRRAWMLPAHPYVAAWPYSLEPWRGDVALLQRMRVPDAWEVLIKEAGGRQILVDHPSDHVAVTRLGGHAVPWFSPQVRVLFARDRSSAAIRDELRARGIRFITVRADNQVSANFCKNFPFLRELTGRAPVASVQDLRIYDLDLLAPAPGP